MDNITKPYLGLNQDTSPHNQPEGTFRYAQNSMIESNEGDFGIITNEQSNEDCDNFPDGYVPIGREYMSNGYTAVFLVSEENSLSEIGILDDNCNYVTHVNADLGFKISNQIDATYRLRRGCERTIYWVDGQNNPPRIYNFDKPEDFQDQAGNWLPNSFDLNKTYEKIPVFEGFEILETGALPAGSYNFAIQYLDEELNPTEWITVTDTIIIYNDNVSAIPFRNVRGSSNEVTSYQDFGNTSKSIRLSLNNLDEQYPFYRIASIEATTGSGNVSRVVYSQEIATQIRNYTYTGSNGFTEGTVEEIQQFSNFIGSAEHIEQLENRLILSNTRGKTVNWCKLQKYASKVKADLVLEEIVLNDLSIENNPKRASAHLEKVGYMPGEIYSFGIVYLFEGGEISPVFSLPGRSPGYFSEMSLDNQLADTFYTDNSNCTEEGYWGVDSQGGPLTNTPVRHHRFPLRSEINKPLLVKEDQSSSIQTNSLILNVSGAVLDTYVGDSVEFVVTYEVGGSQFQVQRTLSLVGYDPEIGSGDILITTNLATITLISVQEQDGNGGLVSPDINSGLTYTSSTNSITSSTDDSIYRSEIMGIKFSNIELPSLDDTNGNKIIGYYIVRNERGDNDRTILDTGVLAPLLVEDREGVAQFVSHGHLMPNSSKLKQDAFALIHPEHKFNNIEYTGTTQYIKEGEYVRTRKSLSEDLIQDVQPGTSYDSENNRRREEDSDGFDLHVVTRNNDVDYVRAESVFAEATDIKETFYLDALFSKSVEDADNVRKDIYNLSSDNRIGIVQLNENLSEFELEFDDKLPYVVMKRELANPYANFRVLPYTREHINPILFTSQEDNEVTIFNGDSYISSMRYTSTMFYDIRLRSRRTRSGVLNFILGALTVALGVVLIATGVGAAAGIAAIGFGVTQVSAGLKKDQLSRVYKDLYEQGLKDTVNDEDTDSFYSENPPDDEIQYFSDTVTNLWFESNVNMNWRMGTTIGLTDFLDSPGAYDESELNTYAVEKVSAIDPSADGGRTYQGYVKAEIYDLNDDYKRREREKLYYHLGIEFDCCSECLEEFPHRYTHSQPSFQEELTDNYRVFLPNNYRDLDGETGVITNLFTIQNNLYLQTEEALWHIPQNIQERATGDIVSFIGTGDFFGIPPRKILDSENGNSGGCQHKWGVVKTPYGVMYPSENQGTVFLFDGNKLSPISNEGMFSWFKNNLSVKYDNNYLRDTGREYPYKNNPSNPFGTGFVSTYDSRNERLLLTKKDFQYGTGVGGVETDYELCGSGDELIIFRNFSQIIANRETDGWTYIGIEDCRMKFQRVTTEDLEVETVTSVNNSTDIHVFFDTSGSFGDMSERCLQVYKYSY